MPWFPIVDAHADTLKCLDEQKRSLCESSARGQSDLGKLLRAGVSLQVLAICTEPEHRGQKELEDTLLLIERFYSELRGQEDAFQIKARADLDLLRPGSVGFMLGIEGAGALRGDPGLLSVMFRLGVRLIGLTWNGRNDFADGVGVAGGGGLTGPGRELLALAEDLGVIVDLSHLNQAGFWDVMEAAGRPVVASHSNARAICDHRRNLDDEQLKAIASAGGVVGINMCPAFLSSSAGATIDDVLRHLDHLISVAGSQSIGLGCDYDGIGETPVELPDIGALPRLIEAMGRLGLGSQDFANILGGNWLRLMRQILP